MINKFRSLVLILFIFPSLSNASLIQGIGFGENNNFIDDGIITTQYRDDGTVWEWLDLTVTNGITFVSVEGDLSDNQTLDSSSYLNGSVGARNDVLNLDEEYTKGWNTVSINETVQMFSDFFGFSILNGDYLTGNTLFSSTSVEDFISLFGDTYHEGLEDGGVGLVDIDPNRLDYGFSLGFSNTSDVNLMNVNQTAWVADYQNANSLNDNTDAISASNSLQNHRKKYQSGTWLNRQVDNPNLDVNQNVSQVPEPKSIFFLSLLLMVLIYHTKKAKEF